MARKIWSENKDKESKISNTEWGMVISLLGFIDVIQFTLDWIGIPFIANLGTIANRLIDVVVGLAWTTYLHLRGVSLKNIKTIGSIMLTFLFEEIPNVDALPLWTADGVFVFLVEKAEEKIRKETGIDAEKVAAVAEGETEAEETAPTAKNEGIGSEAAGAEAEEGNEEDQDRESADENTDESGEESEEKDKDKNKTGGQKNAPAEGVKAGRGGTRARAGAADSDENKNRLNLQNPLDQKEAEEKESSEFKSNLLDLSLSYGQRKEQREKGEE